MGMITRRETLVAGVGIGVGLTAAESAEAGEDALTQIGAQAPFTMLEIGERRIAVTRRGKGRPVLCLHAVGHGARDFEPLAERLKDTCEIIAIDFPGQGRSPKDGKPVRVAHYADIVSSVIDALALNRPILLGNSLGGGAAIRTAFRAPEKVGGLVLCDSAGLIPPSPAVEAAMKPLIGMFNLGVAGSPNFEPVFANFYQNVVLPAPAAKAQRDRIIAAGRELAPLLADAWTGFLEPQSYLGELPSKITVPVWLAWARSDRLVAWDYCKTAATTFPRHSVDFFEGGHSPFLEDPDAFANGLRKFIANAT